MREVGPFAVRFRTRPESKEEAVSDDIRAGDRVAWNTRGD
jgi:hypothetical protein